MKKVFFETTGSNLEGCPKRGATTFSIMTLGIMTLSIKDLFATLSIVTLSI